MPCGSRRCQGYRGTPTSNDCECVPWRLSHNVGVYILITLFALLKGSHAVARLMTVATHRRAHLLKKLPGLT